LENGITVFIGSTAMPAQELHATSPLVQSEAMQRIKEGTK
jgi:hypothetical protein